MADYPGAIYSPRTKTNRSGVVYDAAKETVIFAEDISKDDAEVVAIETELGLNPKGEYADVAARLALLFPFNLFDKFIDLLNWQSLDGYAATVSAACTVTVAAATVSLYVEQTANKYAVVHTQAYYKFPLTATKLVTIEFQITYIDSIDSNNIWLAWGMPWSTPPDDLDDYVGFVIRNGVIYGHCSDDGAATETTTGVTLSTDFQRTRLRIVFNPTVDCKFYVNDVLKLTITTHLKAYDSGRIIIGQQTLVNTSRETSFGRVLIQKIY